MGIHHQSFCSGTDAAKRQQDLWIDRFRREVWLVCGKSTWYPNKRLSRHSWPMVRDLWADLVISQHRTHQERLQTDNIVIMLWFFVKNSVIVFFSRQKWTDEMEGWFWVRFRYSLFEKYSSYWKKSLIDATVCSWYFSRWRLSSVFLKFISQYCTSVYDLLVLLSWCKKSIGGNILHRETIRLFVCVPFWIRSWKLFSQTWPGTIFWRSTWYNCWNVFRMVLWSFWFLFMK